MSFMEAFNQEKKPFLPVLSSKRSEAELSEGRQQTREKWDKLVSQVRGISSSPPYQCERVWWRSLRLPQELTQGKVGRWYCDKLSGVQCPRGGRRCLCYPPASRASGLWDVCEKWPVSDYFWALFWSKLLEYASDRDVKLISTMDHVN